MALTLALMLMSIPLPSIAPSEQAARVGDTYQPQAPTVRYTYNDRCVVTTDSNGNPESKRCGL